MAPIPLDVAVVAEQPAETAVEYLLPGDGHVSVVRERPAGSAAELTVVVSGASVTVSGGIAGARYGLTRSGQRYRLRIVEASAPQQPDYRVWLPVPAAGGRTLDLVTLIRIGPNAQRVIGFEFAALPPGVRLTNRGPAFGLSVLPLKQNGPIALTFDRAGLANANRRIEARFTGATLGDRYRIRVTGTTDQTPSWTLPYTVDVLIEGD
jgi:hypothetical protein